MVASNLVWPRVRLLATLTVLVSMTSLSEISENTHARPAALSDATIKASSMLEEESFP